MSESINVYKAHVFSEDVLEDVVLYADHVRELKELKEELQEERNQKHFCSQVDDMYDDLKQQLATAQDDYATARLEIYALRKQLGTAGAEVTNLFKMEAR
jgi:DNA-binding transcriptional regulator GbsR (MarR family)